MTDNALIIDNGFMGHLYRAGQNTTEAWDSLLDAHDKIILTPHIAEEIEDSNIGDVFGKWAEANDPRIERPKIETDDINAHYGTNFDDFSDSKQKHLGDYAMKYAAEVDPASANRDITIGTSDKGVANYSDTKQKHPYRAVRHYFHRIAPAPIILYALR